MANGKNSIDVDKFDYIARDTQSCGLKSSFDHARLMCHSRVIDNEICFHAKEALNLYVVVFERITHNGIQHHARTQVQSLQHEIHAVQTSLHASCWKEY